MLLCGGDNTTVCLEEFYCVMVTMLLLGLDGLWLGVSKGMLPVRHLAPTILKIMVVNYCGRQPARWLGWAAPAYHKTGCSTLHPGTHMHSL